MSNVANLDPTTKYYLNAHIIDANNCAFILTITVASDPTPTVSASAAECLGSRDVRHHCYQYHYASIGYSDS
jgi:hypothetical protein